MRKTLAVAVMVCVALPALAGDISAAATFERLKTLAGTWESKWPDGKIHTDTWAVASAGSVIMETVEPENVITMYHLDGSRLMLTHYCMLKNQPRMVAEISPDGKTLSFNFLDITNLASPDAKHMHRIVMTLDDANHYTQAWYVRAAGQERPPGVLHYTRRP